MEIKRFFKNFTPQKTILHDGIKIVTSQKYNV